MEAHGASIRIDRLRESEREEAGRTRRDPVPRPAGIPPEAMEASRAKSRLRRLFAPRARARGVRSAGPAGPADRLMIPPNRAL
jgi:hypothetical protein